MLRSPQAAPFSSTEAALWRRLWSSAAWLCAFLAVYVALDWISFVSPFQRLNVTPWNPQIGFAFVVLLVLGPRVAPAVLLGPVLADLITRPEDMPIPLSATISLISGTGYTMSCLLLRRLPAGLELPPRRVGDLARLLVAATASTMIVAVLSIICYVAYGFIHAEHALAAGIRLWIGDLIGIVIVVPLGLVLRDGWKWPIRGVDLVIHGALLVCGILTVLTISHLHQLAYSYVLFLPIVFIAVRLGYEAVVVSLATIQVAVIAIGQFSSMGAAEITTLQGLLLVLAVTGMTAGMLATEQRNAQQALRRQQETQARLEKMGGLGELTSLIAHEINQPLMAAGTYTRMIVNARASQLPEPKVDEIARKAAHQVERAGEIVRRLRELVRLGRSRQEACSLAEIVRSSVGLIEDSLGKARPIQLTIDVAEGVPLVRVDQIQIEQVLLNLMRNSIEALEQSARTDGRILVAARQIGLDTVEIRVDDNGPGIPPISQEELRPLQSSKAHGFGIGLALSRTIVELHRGSFNIISSADGGRVRFTLPIAS